MSHRSTPWYARTHCTPHNRLHCERPPPYHSKYNPIERCWGVLELHWNGALLDSVEAVLGYAETMTWRGNHPEVVLVEAEYGKGVRLGREEMKAFESAITRLPTLEKWFVSIPGRPKQEWAS
ncbi:MAG TPA: hypothetical protein VKP69_21780 [Isosphaeraceae bacterium]|nr:hypothetical protein [Isosphaeraceae bacterium]